MAASPDTVVPPVNSDTHPSLHPPSSPRPRPSQEGPSLTSAAPPETANPDHATSAPALPTRPEKSMVKHSEADQPPPPPIDEVEPPPPLEAAPAASPCGATSPEKPASLSPPPADVPVQGSPKAAALAPSPSPSLSPQIVEDSPEDAPQPPSLLRTPPASAARTSTGPSTTEAVEMASQEASRPSSPPESMDLDSRTAPSPLSPPMESGLEGLFPQQPPGPPSSELAPPRCENSEPAQPPKLCHPSECTAASPDAAVDEVVTGTSGKASGSSPPAPKSMDEDTGTTRSVLPALEIGPEETLPQQQSPRPPCPEIAPPQGENSKLLQPPQPPPPAESSYGCSNAAENEVSAVASGEATPPADGKAALEIGPDRLLQEPVETPTSSRMEADPCSPDMAPPGFEDFKSQWLPLSPQAESTHNVVQVAATNAMGTTADAATESQPSLEAMDAETDISPGLLPPLKSGAEGRSQQQLLGSCSPTTEAAHCSPDMPPPGFENCKSSWLPLRTLQPVAETAYTLPDTGSTGAVAVVFVEKPCSVPVLEATDVETDTERRLLPPLESGTGSSLQGQLPRSRSPMMQATPCSPDIAPPGFDNLKLTQLKLPSPPVVQTGHTLQDSAANEVYVTSEEAPQPSLALEAMDLDMDATPALAPPSESEPEKPLLPKPPLLPSHAVQHTACSQGMVSLGSENVESSQLLPPAAILLLHQTPDSLVDAGTKKTVTMEEVCHPLPVAGWKEEANGSICPPAQENGCEGQLPGLEPQASSPAVHVVATSPEIAPISFENLESSHLTSPSLADTIDLSAHSSTTMPVIAKSEKMSCPLSPSQATDTNMESETMQQSPLKSEERSLPQSGQHPSSPSVKETTCSPEVAPPGYENLDSLEQLPPPPSLSSKFEMGQMVCGCCRQLLAYPRGAVRVQCFGCWTINLVLEEHQVGKVHCGQCDTLLMYPFGAPAVKCSYCLFVTEFGERNVRPRISKEQSVPPHPQEAAH